MSKLSSWAGRAAPHEVCAKTDAFCQVPSSHSSGWLEQLQGMGDDEDAGNYQARLRHRNARGVYRLLVMWKFRVMSRSRSCVKCSRLGRLTWPGRRSEWRCTCLDEVERGSRSCLPSRNARLRLAKSKCSSTRPMTDCSWPQELLQTALRSSSSRLPTTRAGL